MPRKLTPEAARALLDKRKARDPLEHYVPIPTFQECSKEKARFICIQAPNQCLGGESVIWDPVARVGRRIDQIDDCFHVNAWDERKKRMVVAKAHPPTNNGADDLYRVTLSNGQSFVAPLTHSLLCKDGTYRTVFDARHGVSLFRLPSTSDTYPSARGAGVRRWRRISQGSRHGYRHSRRLCDEPPQSAADNGQGASPSLADVPARKQAETRRAYAHADGQGYKSGYSHRHQRYARHASPDGQSQNADPCAESLSREGRKADSLHGGLFQIRQQQVEPVAAYLLPENESFLSAQGWGGTGVRISACDNLVISDCEFVRSDCKYGFEVPGYHNFEHAGAIQHNCGKSSYLTFIAASLLRGRHPHLAYFGASKGLLVIPSRAQAAEIYGTRLLKKSELAGPMRDYPFLPKHDVARIDWAVSPVGRYPGKITMRDGSTLMVVLSGDPNSWKRLEGMTFDWVIRDEVAGSENMGNELVPRLVASHSRTLSGQQPWGGRMWWAATETKFNEEWNDFKTRCKSSVEDHAVYNPQPEEAHGYVSMQAREAMKNSMSKEAYAIRGVGNLDAGDLVQIYGKQWDDKRHMLPADYVIKPSDNINIGYDPGIDHPTGIVIGVNTMDNPTQVKIVKCFLHARESLDFDIECLHSFLLGRKVATFVYDVAAATRHKHAKSLIHELMDKMDARGYRPMGGYLRSDKRHAVGISTVREYLDPKPFDKTAEPRLMLNKSAESGCQMLRSQIIGYHGKESTNFTGAGGVVKKDDDLVDSFRYLLRSNPTWSASYMCGMSTYNAPDPMQAPPDKIIVTQAMTLEAHRARLSAQMANRTKQSIRNTYSWQHRQAIQLGLR